MTVCSIDGCGTGGFTGPVPGDPDNTVSLGVNVVFNGLKPYWGWPALNPHAVSHTRLFRANSNNFNAAVQIATVGGNTFFDELPEAVTRYYWIQIVSVNGTVGETIGPASGTTVARTQAILGDLENQIHNGVLATALRTEIAKITLNYQELVAEVNARLEASEALSAALAQIEAGLTDAIALVTTEIETRITDDEVMASRIDVVAAATEDALAAVLTETTARITEDDALAEQLTTIAASTETNAAAILTTNTALATATTGQATTNTSLYAAAAAAQAGADAAAAAVVTEQSARVAADAALASSITTVQSTLNGNIASAQSALQTNINTVDGKVTQIGALYTMKLSVNGLIGGFGVYNDGREVEAGFDVTRFWIGQTLNGTKTYPFYVDNGIVYMDTVRIKDLTVGGNKIVPGACSWVEMNESPGNATSVVVTIPPFINGQAQIVGMEILVANQQVVTDFGGETGNATYNFGTLKAYVMIEGVPQLVTPTPFDFGTGPHLIRGSDIAPGTYQIVATRAAAAPGYNPPPMKLLVKLFKK
jgi:hypothetical protein